MPDPLALREENVPADADLVVIGNALSRGNPEVEAVLDRKQRMTSMPALLARGVPARHAPRWWWPAPTARPPPPACCAYLLHRAGLRSLVPDRRRAAWTSSAAIAWAAARTSWSRATSTTRAFFDKRPKFVHYLPGRGGDRQRRVRPRRHLSRPGRGADARSCACCTSCRGAGCSSPAWRARRCARSCRGRTRRVRDVRPRRGGRLAGGRRAAGGRGLALPAAAGGARTRATFTLSPARRPQRPERARGAGRRRPRRACRPRPRASALAAFRGVKRRLEVRGRVRGRDRLRRLRAPSDRGARDPARPARLRGAGRLIAVFEPRSYTSRTRVFQDDFARAFADADHVIAAAPSAGQGARRAAALRSGAGGGHRVGRRPRALRAERGRDRDAAGRGGTGGRPRRGALQRRVRRDPREAAGRAPLTEPPFKTVVADHEAALEGPHIPVI